MAANALAYGFVQYSHLAAERVTTVGEAAIFAAIQESAAEYNRVASEMISMLALPVTKHTDRFTLPGTGTLQPLDENGEPVPVRPSGYYDVAYPIQGGGTAFGKNIVSEALMTVAEANRLTVEALKQDKDWMIRHMLSAMLDNTTWTYTDPQYGSLTIQPLANGDAVVYVRKGGSSSTDTHYLAQAAAISDVANPFPTIYDELMEHPSNSGPVVCYVPSALTAAIEALTSFVPVVDPDIAPGIASDRLVANSTAVRGWGDEVLGKVDKCWIVEARGLPSTHIVAHAIGAGPVLGMRQYPAPELQGLFTRNSQPAGNLTKTSFYRYAGFGAMNRVAAVVYYVGGGAYVIPTGYENPIS
ncbi:MAG: hypothetical protein IT364_24565 [Candidatus Hydrogenedentes bacterium]|nr:hypothetical protein [Candidatus Hydrogenedentota bacterium]